MISLEVIGSKGSEGSEGFSNELMNATLSSHSEPLRTFRPLRTLRTFVAKGIIEYFA